MKRSTYTNQLVMTPPLSLSPVSPLLPPESCAHHYLAFFKCSFIAALCIPKHVILSFQLFVNFIKAAVLCLSVHFFHLISYYQDSSAFLHATEFKFSIV